MILHQGSNLENYIAGEWGKEGETDFQDQLAIRVLP